jgi:serine/threonine-protein kinase
MMSAAPFPTEAPPLAPGSPNPSKLGFSGPETPEATRPAGWTSRPLLLGAVVAGAVLLVGGAFYLGWTQLLSPGGDPHLAGSTLPSASAPPVTTDNSVNKPPPSPPPAPLMPWVAQVLEAQQAIATGDLKSAGELLKRAHTSSGNGLPRTMLEHLAVATANNADPKSTCRVTGLARPRSYDLVSSQIKPVNAGRPVIALGPRGPVMSWTDAHEGAEHAYSVALDASLRNAIDPVDVTPESTQVIRPELVRAGDKLVLVYSDARGPEAGVHLRFLTGEGRIDGSALALFPTAKSGTFWPSAARAADDSLYVTWVEEGDPDSEDLFLRRLSATLEPQGPAVRLTDLSGTGKSRARSPSLVADGGALLLAFRQERDPLRLIQQLRIPIDEANKGLEKKPGSKVDRNVGEEALVNTDKAKGDAPALACGGGSCFLSWHVEGGGASAAFLDPSRAQPLWRKKFSPRGGHPAVAVSTTGQGQIVWFENRQVLTAAITREGLGPASRVARISGDLQTPSITAGAQPGEWYLAWLDYETGHLEAYAARVLCK